MADCFADEDDLVVMQEAQKAQEVTAEAEVDDDVLNFQLSLKTKKRKKKKKKPTTTTDAKEEKKKSNEPWEGTERDYTYTELLGRVFQLLHKRNPGQSKKVKHIMPPPQVSFHGSRRSMWSNFKKTCEVMRRQIEHVKAYFFAELGTEGSIDGHDRLIFKSRLRAPQITSILKNYIAEYVTCHMCRNPETTLTRDEQTRLYFVQCEGCNARRSVALIKSGYHATSRADRRAIKAKAT